MFTKRIIKFIKGILKNNFTNDISSSEAFKYLSEGIHSAIGLYGVTRVLCISLWFLIVLIIPPLIFLNEMLPFYSPPQPVSFIHVILGVISLCMVVGLGSYLCVYLPLQPYIVLKFSKKKGKDLANLLEKFSAQSFIIGISFLIFMCIITVLSFFRILSFFYSSGYSNNEVVSICLIILYVIYYLIGIPLNIVLFIYTLTKYKGKPTWFDELKARIEMRGEKHEKDNLGVGER
jgi:flagellar biosynthesis protein FlhB